MHTILLVDDDAAFNRVQCEFLRRAGYTVVSVADGNQALAATRSTRFDLVITDLIMPDREGIETIIALRKQQPGLPIIAMSGGGRISATDHLKLAAQLGAVGTLEKPFSREQLLEMTTRVLGAKSTT